MKNQSIKKIFNDALYFASSTQANGRPYHLTPLEHLLLIKLIHYDSTNKKITYSNKLIAEHIYRTERHVEDLIAALIKKGYITTISFVVSSDNAIKKRRTININWDLIQQISNSLPSRIIKDKENKPALNTLSNIYTATKDNTSTEAIPIIEPALINKAVIAPVNISTKYKPSPLTIETLKEAYPSLLDCTCMSILEVIKGRYNTLSMHLNDDRLLNIINDDEMKILDESIEYLNSSANNNKEYTSSFGEL
jgi:hypothetical protein